MTTRKKPRAQLKTQTHIGSDPNPLAEVLDDIDDLIGCRIGPYRLARKLGAGGMGAVYLGERDDETLTMSVSVKFVKMGLADEDTVKRFYRERQVLADLKHPHIAMLLDGGTFRGQPYFIMEYIEGLTIEKWCAKYKPALPDLLQIFRKIVAAVGYAHRKGVIHRDIKPGNLMVTPEGEPKLLDFGIARLITPEAQKPGDLGETLAMTPEYASPEQKWGRLVDAPSDIYSLALVLLQLITGHAPGRLHKAPLAVVQDMTQPGGHSDEPSVTTNTDRVEPTMPFTSTQDTPIGETALSLTSSTDLLQTSEPPMIAGPGHGLTVPAEMWEPVPDVLGHLLRIALAERVEFRYKDTNRLLEDLDRVIGSLPRPQARVAEKAYDVVIWHHSGDRGAVADLAVHLVDHAGLKVWIGFDREEPMSIAGAAVSALTETKTCLVCLGPNKHIPWLTDVAFRNSLSFLADQVRILPILLPGATFPAKQTELPAYLRGLTWVTFPDGFNQEALERLSAALRGDNADSPATLDGVCPFRGLEVFREQDRHFYFGRESTIQQILARLEQFPFIGVLGPSGCGKSSVVQAGVIPHMRDQGNEIIMFTPNHSPLEELAFVLQQLGGDEKQGAVEHTALRLCQSPQTLHNMGRELVASLGCKRILLIVDQFEEIFTLASDDPDLSAFVANLCYAADQEHGLVSVLVTMRSDFLGKCNVFPDLNNFMFDHGLQVASMNRDDLSRAIESPARMAGLTLEPGLLDRILDDVAGATSELPLLEHALLELYGRRENGRLTLAAYNAIGGIEGALAKRAEAEYTTLDEEARTILRRMFTHCLVRPGEGSEDTRRRAARAELLAVGQSESTVNRLLARWTAARLLTGSGNDDRRGELIDVAHEALIRKWPRIGEWMAEDRETLRLLNRLRQFARAWQESGRHQDHLLRGGSLLQMSTLETWDGGQVGELESAFLKASAAQQKREDDQRRHVRNMLAGMGFGGVMLAMVAFAMFFQVRREQAATLAAKEDALQAQAVAEAETREGNYNLGLALNEKAGIALDRGMPQESWLLSLAALNVEIPAGRNLPEPIGRFVDPRMRGMNRLLWTSPAAPKLVDTAQDSSGRVLALAGNDRRVQLLDTQTGLLLRVFDQMPDNTERLAFSPTQDLLAIGSERGDIFIADSTGMFQLLASGFEAAITDLAFSTDGELLASGDASGRVRVHHLQTGELAMHQQDGSVEKVTFATGNLFVGYSDGSLVLIQPDAVSGAEEIRAADGERITGLAVLGEDTLMCAVANGQLLQFSHTGALSAQRELACSITAAAAEAGSKRMVVATDDPELWVFDDWQSEPRISTLHAAVAGLELRGGILSGFDLDGVLLRQKPDELLSQRLAGHNSTVWSLAYSPDGKTLATGSHDKTVMLWDLAGESFHSAANPRVLRGHTKRVWGIAYSPDGRRLASGSTDKTVRVWDLSVPQPTAELLKHPTSIYGVHFSPDGRRLATAAWDKTVRLWDVSVSPAKLEMSLTGHGRSIPIVRFSPDGRFLASGSLDQTVRLWDLAKGGASRVLEGHQGPVYGVSFSPDGNRLASASQDQTIRLWHLQDLTAAPDVLRGHNSIVYSVVFSPDGSRLASASNDSTLRLWDPAQPNGRPLVLRGHNQSVRDVSFSPDGRHLASSSYDRTVKIWNIAASDNTAVLRGHTGPVIGAVFSPNGRHLASASNDHTVGLWDLGSAGGEMQILEGHTAAVWSAAFDNSGVRLASASSDQTVRLWDLSGDRAKPAGVLSGHTSTVYAVAFSPDGGRVASAGNDRTIRLWDPSDARAEPEILNGHGSTIYQVAFSPDGKRLASSSRDKTVHLWNLSTEGGEEHVLQGHTEGVLGVAFSPDGQRLASASGDHTVRLWDARSGVLQRVLHGHSNGVAGVAFSPDGTLLASSSPDHTVRIWDAEAGRAVAVLFGHQSSVNWVLDFSTDGKLLATASDDRTVRLWRMDHLLFPPAGMEPRRWYGELLNRSLYQMGYRLDGFGLQHHPRVRLQGGDAPSQPLDHLDRPWPEGVDYVDWLMRSTR